MLAHHTREELGHELIIKGLPTVEDHTLQPKRLGQVLDSLSLASAGRACWGAPQMHAEGPSQGHVAAVCHGGDHQPGLGPQVLIPVHKAGIHLYGSGGVTKQGSVMGSTGGFI